MGGGTVFLVPRRPDGGHRDRLWDWCRSHWLRVCPGIPILEGASPEGPFNRSAAINAAAAGDWDTAIILDADVFASSEQVFAAEQVAQATGLMVLGFQLYVGLNALVTRQVLEGKPLDELRGARIRRYKHESSIVVVPRELFDEVGGFDERFSGWGQEDVAFAQACRVLRGEPLRVPGNVYHLHHGKSLERSMRHVEWRGNQELGKRYRATKEVGAMRDLLAERFDEIYRANVWNGTETPAGPGSTLAATEHLREALPRLIADMAIGAVLDAGCSESWWMPELPGYVGVDIVPSAIERARELHPERDFRVADITADDLPRCEAVIVRDALQHLSLKDGLTALSNFRRMGAKWLLASSHQDETNIDVPSGGYFPCNLEAAPFWLGPPRWSIPDGMWASGVRFPRKSLRSVGTVNGPTQREYEALAGRVLQNEKDIQSLREWRSQAKLIATVIGGLAGIVTASIVTAILRAVFE